MTQKVSPSAGHLAFQWGGESLFIGTLSGLLIGWGLDSTITSALLYGAGVALAYFAYGFIGDLWFRFWTVETSEDGIRVNSRRAAHALRWDEIRSFDVPYSKLPRPIHRIEWGQDQSLDLSWYAYEEYDLNRLLGSLWSGLDSGQVPEDVMDLVRRSAR